MTQYFQTIIPQSKLIRAWPYPYRAGLSISNDTEYMSYDFFQSLMQFVNTKDDTVFGRGIGMPMSSSVFFYSPHNYNFSYFGGSSANSSLSPYAPKIIDDIRRKWIDTIHAYGDFDNIGGFKREHAIRYYDELNSHNVSLPIFTNHGGKENIQNIGDDADYHEGDNPQSSAYHLDLMRQNKIRYVWTDSLTTRKVSYSSHGSAIRFLKSLVRSYLIPTSKNLLVTSRMKDGSTLKGFLRFRSTGANAPNLSSFGEQISQIEWDKLYKNCGALVIYQHFGVITRINGKCSAATIDAVKQQPEKYLSPFRILSNEFHAGRLWVARLLRFLDYVTMAQTTIVNKNSKGHYILQANCSDATEEYFSGLTLYVPPDSKVIYNNTLLEHTANPADETGRLSITIKGRYHD